MKEKIILSVLTIFIASLTFASASQVSNAGWYPQGNDYVFVCNPTAGESVVEGKTLYDWYFGDGQQLLNVENNAVFHRYAQNGNYQVSCVIKTYTQQQSGTLSLNTGNINSMNNTQNNTNATNNQNMGSAMVQIAPYYPQGNDYVFICNTPNVNANFYNWDFGDGTKLIGITNKEVFHRYNDSQQYTVRCEGFDMDTGGMSTITVNPQSAPTSQNQNNTSQNNTQMNNTNVNNTGMNNTTNNTIQNNTGMNGTMINNTQMNNTNMTNATSQNNTQMNNTGNMNNTNNDTNTELNDMNDTDEEDDSEELDEEENNEDNETSS